MGFASAQFPKRDARGRLAQFAETRLRDQKTPPADSPGGVLILQSEPGNKQGPQKTIRAFTAHDLTHDPEGPYILLLALKDHPHYCFGDLIP